MTLTEKITYLNDLVDETLTIIHYTEWELSSYGENSMFRRNGHPGPVRAKSFSACIDKALEVENVQNIV